MTDTVKAWIEERRAARVPNSTLSVSDAHNNLPRALAALDSVLEQVEFMETDAEAIHHEARGQAYEVLLDYAHALREAIEGAIRELGSTTD